MKPKNKEPTEVDLLNEFVIEMERVGQSKNLVFLNVDETMANSVASKLKIDANIQKLEHLADRCLANEWLQRTGLGGNPYSSLSITATGLGIVRSTQKKQEALANRSRLKKCSDYIEDHKGLFLAFGAFLTILSMALSIIFGGKK